MSVCVSLQDLILFGHGSYKGGTTLFKLPANIELYILQPIGSALRLAVVQYLIKGHTIEKLGLYKDGNDKEINLIEVPTAVYKPGEDAPDLVLNHLGKQEEIGRQFIGKNTHVVTVNQSIKLSELIKTDEKIKSAIAKLPKNGVLKLYWAACASQEEGGFTCDIPDLPSL